MADAKLSTLLRSQSSLSREYRDLIRPPVPGVARRAAPPAVADRERRVGGHPDLQRRFRGLPGHGAGGRAPAQRAGGSRSCGWCAPSRASAPRPSRTRARSAWRSSCRITAGTSASTRTTPRRTSRAARATSASSTAASATGAWRSPPTTPVPEAVEQYHGVPPYAETQQLREGDPRPLTRLPPARDQLGDVELLVDPLDDRLALEGGSGNRLNQLERCRKADAQRRAHRMHTA